MPFLKKPQTTEPLVKVWDKKAQKCGLHHTVYSVNGDQYSGEWLDNKKHGKGMQVWKQAGIIFDGDWSCGKRNGFGLLAKFDTEKKEYVRTYAGYWKNDKKEGAGTYFYGPSAFYEGHWSKDQRAGWGRMEYENGDVYEGQWLEDKHHGQGVLFLANGNRYVGMWRDGKKNGRGKFLYLDRGQLYEGFWVDGVAKCGTLTDSEREAAPSPTIYPIPKVCLLDPQSVLMEAQSYLTENDEKSTIAS
ncbi:MORN repeat-containing protein 3 [Triplophysa rosa]|uniref:MORN repeat-containing protein 3 n=1 Tax=Triplophysa rosa TaxID=992332 RepID=A0A9W7WBV2_TRIRA|nr:MORN repeat-containing protein 3 [Triplophysa rosa]XP_057176319.1 MORN repeat-containing protein 3 [Triplophysa rosa]KAI7793500.1 MORN repeat-containing protein 3 [Triplophysa rosa]